MHLRAHIFQYVIREHAPKTVPNLDSESLAHCYRYAAQGFIAPKIKS